MLQASIDDVLPLRVNPVQPGPTRMTERSLPKPSVSPRLHDLQGAHCRSAGIKLHRSDATPTYTDVRTA